MPNPSPLLLGGCFAAVAFGCTERRAEIFNRIGHKRVLELANAAISNASFKTAGDCSAVTEPDRLPCREIPAFPVHRTGKDWGVAVEYVTGLDSLRMTNISLRCDPSLTGAPSQPEWFGELDATINEFAMLVSANVTFPRLHKTVLESVPNLTAHIVARVSCVNGTTLMLQLDPAEGSLTLSKVPVNISIIHEDVSSEIVQAVKTKLQSSFLTPPKGWAKLMRLVCTPTAPEPGPKVAVLV